MRELILFVIIKTLMTVILCHQVGHGEVVTISPSPSCLVTLNPCLSLDQLATNTNLIYSNTTLIFLSGIHTLSTELFIFNISHLSLITESFIEQSTTVVICQQNTGFNFNGVHYIDVSRLELIGCKCNVVLAKQLAIENLTFHGKSDSGTALEIIASNASITNSTFIFNRIGRCLTINFELNMTYPTLVGGAIFATQQSNITIVGNRFESNGAEMGGAIFANMGTNMKILNCTFIDNHAAVTKDSSCSGRGVTKLHSVLQLQDIVRDIVQSNSTSLDGRFSMGGAIALSQSMLLIDGCVFDNHTSSTGGAGVLAVQNYSRVSICNSEIFNSHAGRFGGVLTVSDQSHVTVDNGTIYNSSAQQGGVVDVSSGSYLMIRKALLINNTVSGSGGAVVSDQNSCVNISLSQFSNNTAISGGALLALNSVVYIEGNSTLFSLNKASQLGGVINIFQSVLTYYGDCTFKGNQASAGGAIYAEESTLSINGDVTLASNVANTSGGGLYLYHSTLYCTNKSTFSVLGNRANCAGGGIYAANSFITIYYNRFYRAGSFVHFYSNVAHMGGGISLESAS